MKVANAKARHPSSRNTNEVKCRTLMLKPAAAKLVFQRSAAAEPPIIRFTDGRGPRQRPQHRARATKLGSSLTEMHPFDFRSSR